MEESPALVYYENNIPFLYKRSLKYEEGLLKWLVEQGGNSIGLKKLGDFLGAYFGAYLGAPWPSRGTCGTLT